MTRLLFIYLAAYVIFCCCVTYADATSCYVENMTTHTISDIYYCQWTGGYPINIRYISNDAIYTSSFNSVGACTTVRVQEPSLAECADYLDTDGDGYAGITDSCPDEYGTGSDGCPLEPATCSNGSMDGDESGVDCGGSCTASCVNLCNDGDSYNVTVSRCEHTVTPDSFGNCPSGYDKVYADATWTEVTDCAFYYDDTYGSESVYNSVTFDTAPPDFSPFLSTYNSATTSSTVDNGDGTSTVTETTTVINNEGDVNNESTSSSTTTTVINNTTGDTISTNTVTTNSDDITGDASNYNWSTNVDTSGVTGDVDMSLLPEAADLDATLDGYVSNSAVLDIIEGSGVTTSAPTCSLDAEIFSTTVSLDFCSTAVTDKLDLLGAFLVSIGYLMAIFMVFARS